MSLESCQIVLDCNGRILQRLAKPQPARRPAPIRAGALETRRDAELQFRMEPGLCRKILQVICDDDIDATSDRKGHDQ
jgi:hypothetical protein